MPKFIVELRDNDFFADKNSPVVGYVGLVHRGERLSPAVGCVKDYSCAREYDSPAQANYDLNRLSDEFYDRYTINITEATEAAV